MNQSQKKSVAAHTAVHNPGAAQGTLQVEEISREIAEKLAAMHLIVWQGLGQAIHEYAKEAAAILRKHLAGAPAQPGPDFKKVRNIWPVINRYRGLLIDRKLAGAITQDELTFLDSLQIFADWYLEAVVPRDASELEKLEAIVAAPALATPEPPKVEELPIADWRLEQIKQIRAYGLQAEPTALLLAIDDLLQALRPYFPPASQTPPCLKDLERRPRMGSAVIIRDEFGRVLVGQRCKDPFRGYWVIPGGGIWPNETINAAAIREIKEETGLDIEITGKLGIFEDINETFHIIIAMSFGRIIGGELKSGDDCGELRWVGQDEFATLETTPINKQVFALLATPASPARTDGWVDAKVHLPKAPETNDDPEFVYVKWTEAARWSGDEDEDNPRSASGYDTCLIAYLLENPKLISHWQPLPAAPGSVPQAPDPMKDDSRCAICAWPLAESAEKGCVRANCSQRPFPEVFYDLERANREYGNKFGVPARVPQAEPPKCLVCKLPKLTVHGAVPSGVAIYDLPKYFCNCVDGGSWGLSNLPPDQMKAHSGGREPFIVVNPGHKRECASNLRIAVTQGINSGCCPSIGQDSKPVYVPIPECNCGAAQPGDAPQEEKE